MDFKVIAIIIILLFSSVHDVISDKILGLFPSAAPSHYFLGNELMKGLAEAGHDVTILTVFQENNPPKSGKYRQIILENLREEQEDILKQFLDMTNQKSFKNPLDMLSLLNYFGYRVSELVLTHPKTRQLMSSNEKFDIVIVPQFSMEAIKGLAPYFEAHLVILNNHAANSWMNHLVGNPTLPSISPELLLGFPSLMSFIQRLMNTLLSTATYLNYHINQYPSQAELVRKHVSTNLDLKEVLYNVSLALTNSHTSLNKPAALVPCVKEIGGFHVKPPKELPEDLKKYLDEAKNGVIYFSMGSNLKSANLPIETRKMLMKAFSKRKEKILWKFEDENMPGKPDNVRIEKWLPQSDLLAHPNVKLFITHGGFLSTIESMYHAVPTVAIPVMGDQLQNAKQAESFGYAKVIEYINLNEEDLSAAIEEVASNKKYRENIEARSKIFHDRQMKPMQEAIYWLEYIVRHNGAKHLRVGYLDLAWYQYYLMDVLGFLIIVLLTAVFIIFKATRFVLCKLRKLFHKNKETKSKPYQKENKKKKQ